MFAPDLNSDCIYDAGILTPFINSLPSEDEQKNSMVLLFNTINLNTYLEECKAAVNLCSYTDQLRQAVSNEREEDLLTFTRNMATFKFWDNIASRDLVMTVFHFGKALEAIKSSMNLTPIISAQVAHDELREASRVFKREFPDADMLRHAVAHRAESLTSFLKIQQQASPIEGGKEYYTGSTVNEIYRITYKNRNLCIPINNETHKRLAEITLLVYSSFKDLSNLLPKIKIT